MVRLQAIAIALALTAPALAQTSNTGQSPAQTGAGTGTGSGGPASGAAGASAISAADRQYLAKDWRGAEYELEIAQLAVDKAQSPAVKQYAQMIVTDHSQYNAALQQLAQSNGVTLPTELSKHEQKRLDHLKGLSGAAFDTAFVKEAQKINDEDSREETQEEGATRNPAIKAFIDQFKQVDQKHADEARKLQAT